MRWCLPVWLLLCTAAVAAQPAVPVTNLNDSRLVLDSGQFATGLAMPTVSTLRLRGMLTLLPNDYSTPIIVAGRNVTVQPEGLGTAVLDFNDTVAAVLLVQESQLTLRGLQLMHLAPVTAGYSSGSYYSSMSLLWPSINAAPNSKIHLVDTITYFVNRYPGNCTAGIAQRAAVYSEVAGAGAVDVVSDTMLHLTDLSLHANVTSGNVVVGYVEYTASNLSVVCIDRSNAGAVRHTFPAWAIVAIALGSVLILVVGALAALLATYRQRSSERAAATAGQRQTLLPAGDVARAYTEGEGLASDRVRLLSAKSLKRADTVSSMADTPLAASVHGHAFGKSDRTPGGSPRAATELQETGGSLLRRSRNDLRAASGTDAYFLGDYHQHLLKMRLQGGLEGVEMGPILGRGSYGRVYKGRWQGALVAIKVVEHSLRGEEAELEGARESLLAASISHPNVVACYKICMVKLNRTQSDDDDDAAETLDSEEAIVRSVMRDSSQGSLDRRQSIERHGSSAGPSRQGSLVSRPALSRADSSAASSRQHSLQGEELDRLLAQQIGAKGPSPPRPRSLELRGGASAVGTPSPPGTAHTSAGSALQDERGGISPPQTSVSLPLGMSAERRESIAALSRQLSPNWVGGRASGMGRQRSLERGRGSGGSGGNSIHRVSSLDGHDLTVEVIDRAPGIDMESSQLAIRHARNSQDQQRMSAVSSPKCVVEDATFAAAPAAAVERAEGAGAAGKGAGKRSVDLARRLEGRGVNEGPARGMAARQVGQPHPPPSQSACNSLQSAGTCSSGGLETIPSGLTDRTPSDGLSVAEAPVSSTAAAQRTPFASTPETAEVTAHRDGDDGGQAGGFATLTSATSTETDGAVPMELEVLGSNDLAANAHEQGTLIETWMLLEYADRGSLEQAISTGRFLKRGTRTVDMGYVFKTLLDVATGMQYLHGLGIVHGDLKAANVLLKSTNTDNRGFICKLADFGISRILAPSSTHVSTQSFGTVPYMPPELLSQGRMTKSVDVYSFGMLMWQLWTGDAPFKGMQMGQVIFSVVNAGMRPEVPEDMPPAFSALMEACWQTDADSRPIFDDIQLALKDQAQQHVVSMKETAAASSMTPQRPPVQSPFIAATARAQATAAAVQGDQAEPAPADASTGAGLAHVATPFAAADAALIPAAAEPGPSAAAGVDQAVSTELSFGIPRSESSVSSKSSATLGVLAPLSTLAGRLRQALSRSSLSTEVPSVRHASLMASPESHRRDSSSGSSPKPSTSPAREATDFPTRRRRSESPPPRPSSETAASPPSMSPVRPSVLSRVQAGPEQAESEDPAEDHFSMELLEVSRVGKTRGGNADQLQMNYRNSIRADTANTDIASRSTEEADAERFTRLIRKQESGTGPLRYSIELRRSAGPRGTIRRRSVGDRKRRSIEMTRAPDATDDPESVPASGTRRKSFQARRPPDFEFTKNLPRSASVLPDDSDDQREGERSPSASGSSHVRTASEPPPAAQTQSALPAGAAPPTAMAEAALSFASAGPRLRLDSP